MKYWIDTEFIEYPCTIDLISIGIVSEDCRELYIEISDFDESRASPWVKGNVIRQLWSRQKDRSEFNEWSKSDRHFGGFMTKKEAKGEIKRFIGSDTPEFWGYYADYDWVAFCWLMGTMMDLPKGWPMYCRDIKQLMTDTGFTKKLEQVGGEHNALIDAKWARSAYNVITTQNMEQREFESIGTAFTRFDDSQHWRPEDRMDDSFPKVYFEAGYKAGVESTLPTEQEARPMPEPSELDYSCSRLTELANIAHSEAKANGWWDKGDRNIGELFMLMVTELAEGYEAHRNNDAMDDHLPDVPGVHAELADTIIRILDFCGKEKIPIGEIVRRKIEYNRTRGYRHGGKRA